MSPIFPPTGRGLLIVQEQDTRSLILWQGASHRVLPIEAAVEARFAGPHALVVIRELPPEDFGLPETELLRVDLETGAHTPIGASGRHHDGEPSHDGRVLAVNTESGELGDSDLEIWSLEEVPERLTRRRQSLEEPRWRGDDYALVASVLMADPLGEEGEGGSFGGTSFTWPRLHRMGRDLGDPDFLFDGQQPESLATGGSLALWWDDRGLYARQQGGLVLCDVALELCRPVFTPAQGRRIVDGRRCGSSQALLLTIPTRDAFDRVDPDEILRVDLASGRVVARQRAPRGGAFLEIDWVETPR